MRILLTGANGFVGSHILDELRENGFDVTVLLRRSSDTQFIESHLTQGVSVHYGSLADVDALAGAAANVDAIVHCAGKTKALTAAEYHEVNENGTRHVVLAASRIGTIRHLVFISTLAVSGPGTPAHPAQETDPPHPVTIYGKSKLAAEEIVKGEDTLAWTILRPAAVYGPRDRDFLQIFRSAKRGWVPLPGGGRQALSLAYGRDVAVAVRRCLGCSEAFGKTYHVASQPPHTGEDLAGEIAHAIRRPVRTLSIPAAVLYSACVIQEGVSRIRQRPHILNRQKWAELRAPGWVCSTDRIREDLGFIASTTLNDGVAETAAWYGKQGWL